MSIDRCRVEDNDQIGIWLKSSSIAGVEALIRETVLAKNFTAGLSVESIDGGIAHAFADHCSSSNLNSGMVAQGTGAVLRVQASSIAYNVTGLYNAGGGAVVETIGNNMVRGNTFNKLGTITVQPGD